MFDILFGWRKASKCKKLIKQARCRLKHLKNKKSSVVRQAREDIASLLKFGLEAEAFNRIDNLCKDENVMAVYELLDNFCEFVLVNLSYIRRNKDCPNDINEAISSLIFASSRCGDLPELLHLRILFSKRYGQQFKEIASQLLPGNLVNSQMKEKLSVSSPIITSDLKQSLLDEIAREHHVPPKILAIEYPSKLHQQIQVISTMETCQLEASHVNIMEETKRSPSSPETLPNDAEDMIVYLDDIEEVASYSIGTKEDDHFPDQRIFRFKSSSPLPKIDQVEDVSISIAKHPASSSISGAERVKPTRKRRRCRNPIQGNSKMEDEYSGYYDSPCRKSRVDRHHRNNPSHVAVVERQVKPPYVRAMTMPQVRLMDRGIDNVARSKSLPLPVPSHVHPKLPDYDEVAAKFKAYRREYGQQIA